LRSDLTIIGKIEIFCSFNPLRRCNTIKTLIGNKYFSNKNFEGGQSLEAKNPSKSRGTDSSIHIFDPEVAINYANFK